MKLVTSLLVTAAVAYSVTRDSAAEPFTNTNLPTKQRVNKGAIVVIETAVVVAGAAIVGGIVDSMLDNLF